MKLDKYEQNLKVLGDSVYSYDTKVAIIHRDHIEQLGWWSKTTQKHINYCSEYFNKQLIKKED